MDRNAGFEKTAMGPASPGPMPRRRSVKKQNAGDRHDRCASGENCRNCGERSALLEQKEERDRSCADTDSSEQRVIEPGAAEFLVPASAEPENRQINQDRQ